MYIVVILMDWSHPGTLNPGLKRHGKDSVGCVDDSWNFNELLFCYLS